MINIVFGCLFLGERVPPLKKVWRVSGPQLMYGQVRTPPAEGRAYVMELNGDVRDERGAKRKDNERKTKPPGIHIHAAIKRLCIQAPTCSSKLSRSFLLSTLRLGCGLGPVCVSRYHHGCYPRASARRQRGVTATVLYLLTFAAGSSTPTTPLSYLM